MHFTITLPADSPTLTIRDLLEKEWLIPRKVRHFLRIRKNVLLNNQPVLFHQTVSANDQITLKFEKEDYQIPTIHAGNSKLVHVLFEDEHLIIINKPVGMKTHPNQPDENDTLLNHLTAYLKPKQQIPYVVHRLDKETCGAILFAKNPFVLPILGRMLEKKQIYRCYQAIVDGIVLKNTWTITKKIGRDRHDRRKRIIDSKHGMIAITHIQKAFTLTQENKTALLCRLETGRTHQIRVHLANAGFPIIGDPLYNTNKTGNNKRLMLHAYELHIKHPFSKQAIVAIATPGLW